jgi:hypothetical protein
MTLQVSKKMGDATFKFTFEGTDIKDALFKAAFLMDEDKIPTWKEELKEFQGQPVVYKVRKTKEGDLVYVERKVYSKTSKNIASSNLGTYKQGGYFWKDWEVFNPDVPKGVNEPRDLDF